MTERDPHLTYDRIAADFARTRAEPWPEVESFLEGRTGGRGIDVGCGNGRHTEPLAGVVDRAVGVDASRGLLAEAVSRAGRHGYGADFLRGDASRLPCRDSRFDVGLYVATIHHLSGRRRRVESLNELSRVLVPDGEALVSAWSTVHDRFDREEGFDTTVDWTLPGGETVPRFYHIYDPPEFRRELADSGLRVASLELSSGNCYAAVSPR